MCFKLQTILGANRFCAIVQQRFRKSGLHETYWCEL